jgi:hypothetical protein
VGVGCGVEIGAEFASGEEEATLEDATEGTAEDEIADDGTAEGEIGVGVGSGVGVGWGVEIGTELARGEDDATFEDATEGTDEEDTAKDGTADDESAWEGTAEDDAAEEEIDKEGSADEEAKPGIGVEDWRDAELDAMLEETAEARELDELMTIASRPQSRAEYEASESGTLSTLYRGVIVVL